MCSQRWMFTIFTAIRPGSQSIVGIKGVSVKVLGEGDVVFVTKLNGVNHHLTIQHVLFAPDLEINLFSIAAVTNLGWDVHFIRCEVIFFCNQVDVMVGSRVGLSLYHLNISVPQKDEDVAVLALPIKNTYGDWHSRLGHISNDIIKKMAVNEAVDGLTLSLDAPPSTLPCHGCILGKMKRLVFPNSSSSRSTKLANSYTVISVVQCKLNLLEMHSTFSALQMIVVATAQ